MTVVNIGVDVAVGSDSQLSDAVSPLSVVSSVVVVEYDVVERQSKFVQFSKLSEYYSEVITN